MSENLSNERLVLVTEAIKKILKASKKDRAMIINCSFGKVYKRTRAKLSVEQEDFLADNFGLRKEDFQHGLIMSEEKVRWGVLAHALLNDADIDEKKSEKLIKVFQMAIKNNRRKLSHLDKKLNFLGIGRPENMKERESVAHVTGKGTKLYDGEISYRPKVICMIRPTMSTIGLGK